MMNPSENPSVESTMPELHQTIQRYLKSVSKGPGTSGTYKSNAETALTAWAEWLIRNGHTDLDALNDPSDGPLIVRRYAQHLADRESNGELAVSSVQTYYSIISAFLSYAVRDGMLNRNPALADSACEPLPRDAGGHDQQFWTPEIRNQLKEYVGDRIVHCAASEFKSALRDRAIVYTLAYTGLRGAELFKSNKENREGRRGLRWKNVDTDDWTLRILGKSQEWENAPVLKPARNPIFEYREVYDPASDDWPLFPTAHRPSRYDAAIEGLTADPATGGHGLEEEEAAALIRDQSADHVFREYDITPPALTIGGARGIVKRLCEDADIEIDEEYLRLHGARRGIGDEVYREDPVLAQELLRHRDLTTTKKSYSYISAKEVGDKASEIVD